MNFQILTELINLAPSYHSYYDTALSSVYLWDLDDGAFAGVVLFKKGEEVGETASIYSVPMP